MKSPKEQEQSQEKQDISLICSFFLLKLSLTCLLESINQQFWVRYF